MGWVNGLAEWVEGDTAFLSVAFSWRLPDAYQRAVWLGRMGYRVRAGGPGMFAPSLRYFLADVAELGGSVDALPRHNKDATMASRGCPVGCYFCIVPKMEGREFTLMPEFQPRPILCDNNLSALPDKYQEFIIEKYRKSGVELLDANSGFEPRTFSVDTFLRWRDINRGPWRFAFDEMRESDDVIRTAKILWNEPSRRKRVYVLIGNEPMAECLTRIYRVIELGCEPYAQPLMALNALERSPIVRHDWTRQGLIDVARWVNRFIWRNVNFSDYSRSIRSSKTERDNNQMEFAADFA